MINVGGNSYVVFVQISFMGVFLIDVYSVDTIIYHFEFMYNFGSSKALNINLAVVSKCVESLGLK